MDRWVDDWWVGVVMYNVLTWRFTEALKAYIEAEKNY